MKTLICPVSAERTDGNVVRIMALMTAAMIALYAATGAFLLVLLLALDYVIRVFVPKRRSPITWLACQTAWRLELPVKRIDKAPKIFAVRVGFLFALAMVVLSFIHPLSAVVVGLALMTFNLLDALFSVCVGCITYTYLVFPILGD